MVHEDRLRDEDAIAQNMLEVDNTSKVSKHIPLIEYAGMYGNLAMGNISVVYDSVNDTLTAYYGTTGIFRLIYYSTMMMIL